MPKWSDILARYKGLLVVMDCILNCWVAWYLYNNSQGKLIGALDWSKWVRDRYKPERVVAFSQKWFSKSSPSTKSWERIQSNTRIYTDYTWLSSSDFSKFYSDVIETMQDENVFPVPKSNYLDLTQGIPVTYRAPLASNKVENEMSTTRQIGKLSYHIFYNYFFL